MRDDCSSKNPYCSVPDEKPVCGGRSRVPDFSVIFPGGREIFHFSKKEESHENIENKFGMGRQRSNNSIRGKTMKTKVSTSKIVCLAITIIAAIGATAQPLLADNFSYTSQITLGNGKSLIVSLSIGATEDKKIIEKCTITVSTKTKNPDGSITERGMTNNGYGINITDNGKFSAKIADFLISGTLAKNQITGSIKTEGKSYSYSAKEGNPRKEGNSSVGDISPYRSIESSNIMNTTLPDTAGDVLRRRSDR